MEDHAQSGWLCALVVGSDDARVKESEFVKLLVDTRATEHVCGLHDFIHAALKKGPRPALNTLVFCGMVEASQSFARHRSPTVLSAKMPSVVCLCRFFCPSVQGVVVHAASPFWMGFVQDASYFVFFFGAFVWVLRFFFDCRSTGTRSFSTSPRGSSCISEVPLTPPEVEERWPWYAPVRGLVSCSQGVF